MGAVPLKAVLVNGSHPFTSGKKTFLPLHQRFCLLCLVCSNFFL